MPSQAAGGPSVQQQAQRPAQQGGPQHQRTASQHQPPQQQQQRPQPAQMQQQQAQQQQQQQAQQQQSQQQAQQQQQQLFLAARQQNISIDELKSMSVQERVNLMNNHAAGGIPLVRPGQQTSLAGASPQGDASMQARLQQQRQMQAQQQAQQQAQLHAQQQQRGSLQQAQAGNAGPGAPAGMANGAQRPGPMHALGNVGSPSSGQPAQLGGMDGRRSVGPAQTPGSMQGSHPGTPAQAHAQPGPHQQHQRQGTNEGVVTGPDGQKQPYISAEQMAGKSQATPRARVSMLTLCGRAHEQLPEPEHAAA
jgi:hypothetical protein